MVSVNKKKIKRKFYDRPTLEVASDIIGKYIVFNSPHGKISARIVETEAYIGDIDPACHAYRGMTKRNKPLFGLPGFSYVYFIYGMYHCFNFVTEQKGKAAALLLRAGEPEEGIENMHQLSPNKKKYELLNGPGKFCRSFGFNMSHNEVDLTGSLIYLEDRKEDPANIEVSHRIGISEGKEKLWRYFDASSKSVSKK